MFLGCKFVKVEFTEKSEEYTHNPGFLSYYAIIPPTRYSSYVFCVAPVLVTGWSDGLDTIKTAFD